MIPHRTSLQVANQEHESEFNISVSFNEQRVDREDE